MREHKISLRHFHYRECDAFAKYLEEQAAKGWHLKDWRFGLIFERGEPKEEKYAVEVFTKSDERASRPEKDAEEFAEYCKAAGWELVDGRRKFCVFRAIRSDAIPIATPEERYENICKSERERLWMPLLLVVLSFFIIKMMRGGLYRFGFENSQLFSVGILVFMTTCSVIDALAAVLWRRRRKRQIEQGEIPVYGKTFGIWYEWFTTILVTVILGMRLAESVNIGMGEVILVLIAAVPILVLGMIGFVSAAFRPSVERRVQIHGILMVVAIIVLFCIGGYAAMKGEPEMIPETYAPLKQEDFKEVTGERNIYREESATFLGKKYEYCISYWKDELLIDQMRYEGYESSYAWVIDRLWETREKWDFIIVLGTPNNEAVSEMVDCKEMWEAEEAWTYQIGEPNVENYCYEVRYSDKVVVLHTMEELDAEDIKVVREKLDLK